MKINELKNEGLLREFEVSVPAAAILQKVEAKIEEEKKDFKMAGYRDGKVPDAIVRKKIGPEIMAKEIEKEVDETLKKIFEEKNIRPALQPFVEVKKFDEKGDLSFTVKVEIFPEVPNLDMSKLEIEILKIDVSQDDIAKAYEDILKNFKNFNDAPASYAAKKGDAVIIDFQGSINDKPFEGGRGDGIRLELGSGQFIPGFEDQLIGAKEGNQLKVRLAFPKTYGNRELAGKPAVFDVAVKKVMKPESVETINDDFAKKLGLEDVNQLNEMIKQKIEADFNGLSRLRTKKILFDKIDSVYRFDIPDGMLKIDFDTMWNEYRAQKESNPAASKGKTDEQMRNEYMDIAKRRVRLGILLAEIARINQIEVNDNDLQQAVYAEAMLRPGQEKIVLDYYSKRENMEKLRGPILEEKAVDHILGNITKNEVSITSKEFFEKYAEDFNPANGNSGTNNKLA
jgi:trigger factor